MGYYLKRFKNLALRALTLTKYNTIYSRWYCDTCKKQVKSDHECANDYKKIDHEVYYLGLNKPKPPEAGEPILYGSVMKLPQKIDYRPIMQSGGWRVRDQGKQGSCTAQAGVADKAYQEIVKNNYPGPFSAAYLYYEERKLHGWENQDTGANMVDIGTVLGRNGVCLESNMPYKDYDYTTPPEQEDHDQAKEWKCEVKQTRIWDENALKQALVNGPVRIGVPIPKSFWQSGTNGGFVPCTYDSIQGYHAMLAVGYDDNLTSSLGQKGHFIVCNSWGQFYGAGGYVYIPYAWIGHYRNNNDHRQQFDFDNPIECTNGETEVLELCETDPSKWKKRRVCKNNKWEVEYRDCPNCKEGDVDILEYCENDPERWKMRKVCKNSKWITEVQDCPEDPTPVPQKTRYQFRKSDDGGVNWVVLYEFGW